MKTRYLLKSLLAVSSLATAWSCASTKPGGSTTGAGGGQATGAGGTGAGGASSSGAGGSGTTTGAGGSGASTGAGGGAGMIGVDGNCGLQTFKPTPKNADIMMVLDRSGSMQDVPEGAPSGSTTTKWQIVVPAMQGIVSATQTSISWGLKAFPDASTDSLSDCTGGVSTMINVDMAAMDGTAMNNAIMATTPNGSGTPTADAITVATNYMKTVTDANPKYLLLATDGEPDCVGTTKDETNAGPAAVTAIGAALNAGFPTFVVGIATSKSSANTELNMMAMAGGEGVVNSNPLANHYYVANDTTTLVASLQAITGQISTCLFPLNPPPVVLNDPTKTGVYLGANQTKVPYDASQTDGWAFTDQNDTAIEVYGDWCTMIEAAGAGAVQVDFACGDIIVP